MYESLHVWIVLSILKTEIDVRMFLAKKGLKRLWVSKA